MPIELITYFEENTARAEGMLFESIMDHSTFGFRLCKDLEYGIEFTPADYLDFTEHRAIYTSDLYKALK